MTPTQDAGVGPKIKLLKEKSKFKEATHIVHVYSETIVPLSEFGLQVLNDKFYFINGHSDYKCVLHNGKTEMGKVFDDLMISRTAITSRSGTPG